MVAGMLHLLAMLNSFYGIVKGDNSNVLHSDCRLFCFYNISFFLSSFFIFLSALRYVLSAVSGEAKP